MTVECVNDPLVANWVCQRMQEIGEEITPRELAPCVALGIVKDGDKPVAGAVFNGFREMPYGNDMRVIFAAQPTGGVKKIDIISPLLNYVFNKAQCERLTAVISEANKPSQRFVKRLGFRKEGVLRKGYNGKTNAIVYGLLRSEAQKQGFIA